jgi:hypothetical protein
LTALARRLVFAALCVLFAFPGRALAQTALPSPLPSPTSSPAAAAKISVDRHSLVLAPGATATVHVFGASNAVVTSTVPGVNAVFNKPTRTLLLTANQIGSGTITVTDDAGNSDAVTVAVLAPAGVVPPTVALNFAGTPSRSYLAARIRSAIVAATKLEPGLTVSVQTQGIDLPAVPAADFSQDVPVVLRRPNFSDVQGTVRAHVTISPAFADSEPVTLLYSDDPETVAGDGVLLHSTTPIDTTHPARLYAYHEAGGPDRQLFLIIRTKGTASQVQLTGDTVGPYGDFVCIGHQSTKSYLEERSKRVGTTLDIGAPTPAIVQLNARLMPARTLVAAIYDIHVLSGDPVDVTVVTSGVDVDPLSLLGGSELPGDGHQRRGEYDLSKLRPIALTYTVGQAADAQASVGAPSGDGPDRIASLRPGGAVLAGEYGVLRRFHIEIANPGAVEKNVYLYMTPVNGTDSMTLWFDGDAAATEVARVADPSAKYLVRTLTVPPATTKVADGEFLSDGASWYPLEIGLTETPPVVADPAPLSACAAALNANGG